jgi:hypothetical protein
MTRILRDIDKTSRNLGVISRKTVGPEFISKPPKIARQLGEERGSSQAQVAPNGWTCEKKRSESGELARKIFEFFFR